MQYQKAYISIVLITVQESQPNSRLKAQRATVHSTLCESSNHSNNHMLHCLTILRKQLEAGLFPDIPELCKNAALVTYLRFMFNNFTTITHALKPSHKSENTMAFCIVKTTDLVQFNNFLNELKTD